MAEGPVLNFRDPETLGQLLPTPPLLTSQPADWSNLFLADYLHPGYEVPEHALGQPILELISPNASVHNMRCMDGVYETYRLDQREITFCPAHCSHSARWEEPVAFTLLIFDSGFFAQLIDQAFTNSTIELAPKWHVYDPVMHTMIQALKTDLEAGCPAGRLYGETFGTALAVHLIKQFAAEPVTLPEYKNKLTPIQTKLVLDYMDEHLAKNISLEQLAGLTGISVFHFCRLFKQSMGMAPHQYLVLQRVERAKQLLKSGDLNLSEIAGVCGFSHQSHLNRHFKRLVGTTPKNFRDHSKNVLI